jgi:branched-chain amino acid transport system substrate-binding protein
MADTDRTNQEEEKGLLDGKQVSRREFLKIAGITGASVGLAGGLGGLVVACGGEEATTTTAAPTTATTGGPTTTAAVGSTTSVSATEQGREIKIGFISPLTGGIASFGVPDQYCADRAAEAIGAGLMLGDGKMHPISIIIKDSQSDTARAAQVTGDLINNDKVDLIVTASTPDTVCPVADIAESMSTPCISNDCPWQAYVATRAAGDLTKVFKWTYHTFWGLEDVQANFMDMWGQVSTNKKVAAMWSNDADGQAWQGGWGPVFGDAGLGLSATIPSQFTLGTEDFSTQIAEFKKQGCEIGVGVFIPPDFTTFWKQATQQGWKPRVASFAKALLFPESVASVGDVGAGLTTEVWWTPAHPFKSSLNGETCEVFAKKYSEADNNRQWTQPLLHFIIFEMAIDALKRAKNPEDKASILEAIKGTKLDTIGGPIDFTAPIEPVGPPWATGPRHVVENVYKTPVVGGQWRKGTTYPFELTIVSDAGAKGLGIPVQDKVQPLV